MPTYENIVVTIEITAPTIDGETVDEVPLSIKEAVDSIFPSEWTVVIVETS